MSISTTIVLDGQTVTIVNLPATPGLSSVDFTAFDAVGVVPAPFVGRSQAHQWPGGDMWSGIARVPPLAEADADTWITFLEELRGQANAFQMGDPTQPFPRGSGAGEPFADDTLNNGNPAGSPMIGTKGWTPNAAGVLLPGDYFQTGFRLYRALDMVNADSGGRATFPIWPSLREQAYNDGTFASWVNATGAATKTFSATLGGYSWGAIWYNFSLPFFPLPADAVIQGIYPVIISSGIYDAVPHLLYYGLSSDIFAGGGLQFTIPYDTSGITATYASTQFYAASAGTTLGLLSGQAILMALNSSFLEYDLTDAINATGVGYAVYYTSATPLIDPTMPPPFAVPAGQGLAWSVPFSYSLLGPPAANGTTTATAGSPNGGLIFDNPLGLWRLSDNKRDYATDVRKVTPLAFGFKEYR